MGHSHKKYLLQIGAMQTLTFGQKSAIFFETILKIISFRLFEAKFSAKAFKPTLHNLSRPYLRRALGSSRRRPQRP